MTRTLIGQLELGPGCMVTQGTRKRPSPVGGFYRELRPRIIITALVGSMRTAMRLDGVRVFSGLLEILEREK